MQKIDFLKKLVFAWLVLNFNIFGSCGVMMGDSEYEDSEIEGRISPGRLIKAGMIPYSADDVIAYALKVAPKDIADSLESEEGRRYLATPEGKEKFLESIKAYLSGDTTILREFSRKMEDLVQNPHQIDHDKMIEYVFYTSNLFQTKKVTSGDKRGVIQSVINYYNNNTIKFNNNQISLDYYYRMLGIDGPCDGCNFKRWDFNNISSNFNKSLILHMVNERI